MTCLVCLTFMLLTGSNYPIARNGGIGQIIFLHFFQSILTIDLMHNDVKQCFHGSKVHCGSCSHERNSLWLHISPKRKIQNG